MMMFTVVWFLLILGGLSDYAASCSVHGEYVDCSYEHLTALPEIQFTDVLHLNLSHNKLSELPQFGHVPLSNLRQLDVSNNAIKKTDQHAFCGLRQLQSLNVSHNQIRVISNRTFACLSFLESLNLDHNQVVSLGERAFQGLGQLRSLTMDYNSVNHITEEAFKGLRSLVQLSISHNEVRTLHNLTFSDLTNLQTLVISYNRLQTLEKAAFLGLKNLTLLDLTHNDLQLQDSSSVPPGVFAALTAVETARLQFNAMIDEYPQHVFADLVSVQYLSVDTSLDPHFGLEFAHLRSIQILDLSENCVIKKLSNDSFEGFRESSLRSIILTSCEIMEIETCTFCGLPHLERLYLDKIRYLRPSDALLCLYGLQNNTMETITFHGSGISLPTFYTLDRHSARFLRNICVRRVDMSRFHLQRVTSNAVSESADVPFARCIEDLDFSENYLIGDTSALFLTLLKFKKLVSFRVQELKIYSLKDSTCVFRDELHCTVAGSPTPTKGLFLNVTVPETLTRLQISLPTLSQSFKTCHFKSAKRLKIVDLSFSAMSNCLITISGLDVLEKFDLSYNNCHDINVDIFKYLSSLRELSLSRSNLNPMTIRTRAHKLLRYLDRLEKLDLSRNELNAVEGGSLPVQAYLQELTVSHNSFQSVPVDLTFHPNLTVLDLAFNSITSLTLSEQRSLDWLAAHHSVRLHLRGNPLLCACSSLTFLRWLWETSVILDGEGSSTRKYTCTTETGEMTNTEEAIAEWEYHWRRCIGQRVFGLVLALFFLQHLAVVVVYVIFRNWTHICYTWKSLRRRLPERLHDFTRDVYFVYADTDRDVMWACLTLPELLRQHRRDLRILLRNQEEVAGANRAESIAQHIEISWKVLLLVTATFFQDEWACGFAVKQALRGVTDNTPDRVIVVFMEDLTALPQMRSLEMLLREVPGRNVFHVRRDTPAHDDVWKALTDAIIGGHKM